MAGQISSQLGDLERFGDAIGNGDVLAPVVRQVTNDVQNTAETLARRTAGTDGRLSNYRNRSGGRGRPLSAETTVRGTSGQVDLIPRPVWGIVLGGTRRHLMRQPSRHPWSVTPAAISGRGRSRRATAVRSGTIRHPGHRRLGVLDIDDDLDQIPDLVDRELDWQA